jgi:hypothetical protein
VLALLKHSDSHSEPEYPPLSPKELRIEYRVQNPNGTGTVDGKKEKYSFSLSGQLGIALSVPYLLFGG